MASYNRVILMGNLTRDVELKYTQGNTAVAQIGVAVNRKYKGRDEKQHEETTFVDCEAWGRTAEVMNEYLHKGSPVHIEGRLKLDQWEDKTSGQKRSKLKVTIESFQFVSEGKGGGGGGGAESQERAGTSSESQERAGTSGDGSQQHQAIEDEDIPF